MRLKVKEKIIYIEESVIIVLFVCLLSNIARKYLESYYLCYLFITFHELSHILIASLLGFNLIGIHIRISGLSANLENNYFGFKALLIYLAGPLSNILLATMFSNIKIIFEINLALALINLIPIKPLDGYNILAEILEYCMNKKVKKSVLKIVSIIIEICLIVISILLFVKYCNISLIILLIYIKLENLNAAK